ncbi:MAG: hypothetical protein DWQ04_01050 [Chloroflexi bacterium]|nr:MAG: hypothetical protein DWQ04_01050 [Chloroflexota bacterium]
MKYRLFLLVPMFMIIALFVGRLAPASAVATDCASFVTDSDMPMESTKTISFDCTEDTVVYFGVCDSGNVPNDDAFNMVFNGQLVAQNIFENITDEYTEFFSKRASAGTNYADLNSLNSSPYPPATFSYAISPDLGDVENHLRTWCGDDWKGLRGSLGSNCDTNVPIFTTDAAPTDGTLELHVLLGNEGARGDEIVFQTWEVSAGEQLNNVFSMNLPAPRYLRYWWQPAGGSDWTMLTSQYWQGGGSLGDQFGLECGVSPQPSYHTSFASAVAESDVCFDLLNGCD